MAIDINFGALEQPNIFASYAKGQEYGQKQRQDQARRQAFNLYATDPEAASQALLRTGDLEGAEAIRKYGAGVRQDKARASAAESLGKGDYSGAREAAIGAGDFDLATQIGTLDKSQREAAKERAGTLASIGYALKGKPYEERRAVLQSIGPALEHMGMDPQMIAGFDPTDQNIDGVVAQSMTLQQHLEQADREQDNARADRQLTETQRHNRTSEATASRNASTSAFSAQTGRLNYDARKAAGGFGTPGMGKVLGSELDPNDGW